MKIDEKYIRRCIQLAQNGIGTTYPNPLVGSVIVHKEKIIGEGWHKKSGEAHAEVNAINSVKDKSLLTDATIYVSLEPCNHFGKTPPCSDLIIKYKIPNVVIGTIDPNKEVSGKGIKKLEEQGINVIVGVLEKECNELNKRFFTFHNKKRPYVILKWAVSKDGFIAPLHKEKKEPFWISNEYSRQIVHKWRTEEQGILVGTKTVLDDNPKLDARDWYGNNPTRIVLDKSGKISNDYFVKDQKNKTIIITEVEKNISNENIKYESNIFDFNLSKIILKLLYKNDIQSVIIEGGKQTIQTFIDTNTWDEARIVIGDMFLSEGVTSPIIKKRYRTKNIIKDQLNIILNHD